MEESVSKIKLRQRSDEYKKVESAFQASASNKIIKIERIQNKVLYQLYNIKCKAMEEKYGSDFPGKELWLFHGTKGIMLRKLMLVD